MEISDVVDLAWFPTLLQVTNVVGPLVGILLILSVMRREVTYYHPDSVLQSKLLFKIWGSCLFTFFLIAITTKLLDVLYS